MPTKLIVKTYSSSYSHIEPRVDDEWDRGSSSQILEIESVSLGEGNYGEKVISRDDLKVGDKVYLVWGNWGSGDTFGYDEGCYAEFFEVTKNPDLAHDLKDLIEAKTHGGKITYEGVDYYVPWGGYFDSLEKVEVWEGTVSE